MWYWFVCRRLCEVFNMVIIEWLLLCKFSGDEWFVIYVIGVVVEFVIMIILVYVFLVIVIVIFSIVLWLYI